MKKIVILAIVVLICLHSVCFGQSWPEITPVSGELTFADPKTASFQVDITDTKLVPIYILSCQSGDMEDKDFNYSGLFHCRLIPSSSKENVSSLLVENLPQTADWEGRSRFLLNQVVGQCANLLDWGATRTFQLRQMHIILGVHNVDFSGSAEHPEVKSFRFTYDIKSDSNATSSIALKSLIIKPEWFASGCNCVKKALGEK